MTGRKHGARHVSILLLLTMIYAINYMDRQVLSIFIEPVKADLGLTDTQIGLLTGIAFAAFYASFGIPLAILADRWSRRKVIVMSVALFSAMTAACGMAQAAMQLALARIGVGIGEAGTTPASHALISELYPADERAGALGFFSSGVNLGIIAGFALGGLLAAEIGWRWAFIFLGLPGLLLALLAFLVVPESSGRTAAPSIATLSLAKACLKHKGLLMLMVAGAASIFAGYGIMVWSAPFYARHFGLAISDVGLFLAIVYGVLGFLGTWLSGLAADRASDGENDRRLFVPAIVMLVSTPLYIVAILADDMALSMLLFTVPAMFVGGFMGPVVSVIQDMVALGERSRLSALYMLVVNLVGLGLGTMCIGYLSDHFTRAGLANGLGWAMAAASLACVPAGVAYIMAARYSAKLTPVPVPLQSGRC